MKRWGQGLVTSLAFARLVPEKSSNWISKIPSRWSGRYRASPNKANMMKLENHHFFKRKITSSNGCLSVLILVFWGVAGEEFVGEG